MFFISIDEDPGYLYSRAPREVICK